MSNITALRPLPKAIMEHFRCRLLHETKPTWDGTYYYDEQLGINLPNIKYFCKICDKYDHDSSEDQETSRTTP
jgi:hypothetical protein